MSLAFLVLASSSPSCEIRQLLVHVYPGVPGVNYVGGALTHQFCYS